MEARERLIWMGMIIALVVVVCISSMLRTNDVAFRLKTVQSQLDDVHCRLAVVEERCSGHDVILKNLDDNMGRIIANLHARLEKLENGEQ